MCKPEPRVSAGAMLVALVGPRLIVSTAAVLGGGVALVVVAGSMLSAYVWMVLIAWAAITTTMLLVRRANEGVRVIARPPAAAPERAPARVLEARPRLALPAAPAARSDVTYVVEQCEVVGSGR